MPGPQKMFAINEPSQISAARRALAELAREAALSEVEAGNAAIALTEVATNMLKHAGSGELLLRTLGTEAHGLEIVALDNGPGMDNWELSSRDGYSTGSSPGNGLGAMRRLSTEFDVYTRAGKGSVFRMAFWREGAAPAGSFELGVVCVPVMGETECGDGWLNAPVPAEGGGAEDCLFLVADGLGHGPEAALAAQAAAGVAERNAALVPTELLERIHGALRATRGAAVACARAARQANGAVRLRFAGIGNISAGIHAGEEARQFASQAGIVGHNMRKTSEFTQDWPAGALLIMHSDGLISHWNLDKYPGLSMRHCGIIAAVLYRDLARGRDDVTVLVARLKGE